MTTYKFGSTVVTVNHITRTVSSRWPDGADLVARPTFDEESGERATALGYRGPNAVWEMTAHHDLCHHVIAQVSGAPNGSKHLRRIATNTLESQAQYAIGEREERLVLLLQRAMIDGTVVLDEYKDE